LWISGADASDYFSEGIRFADSPERARQALNKKGFNLPTAGTWRDTSDGGGIAILTLNGHTTLVCSPGAMF
jgi:hypothetical protein